MHNANALCTSFIKFVTKAPLLWPIWRKKIAEKRTELGTGFHPGSLESEYSQPLKEDNFQNLNIVINCYFMHWVKVGRACNKVVYLKACFFENLLTNKFIEFEKKWGQVLAMLRKSFSQFFRARKNWVGERV